MIGNIIKHKNYLDLGFYTYNSSEYWQTKQARQFTYQFNKGFLLTMFLFYVLSVVVVVLAYKIIQKHTCGFCYCNADMSEKVVIITGANTGIGFVTAEKLAKKGAKVILACRDAEKGKSARDKIRNTTSNRNVFFKQLDLTSFESVRAFANDILKTEPKIHILINNAGTGILDNRLTEDKLPIEPQVNHFSPFLLTVMLLPLLKSSAPSRIVNVASIMHWFGEVNPENFHKQATNLIGRRRVYSDTKLANILFTNKLSRDLQGTGVTANSLHPGAVNTDIFRNKMFLIRFMVKFIFKTPLEGAQTSIHLAMAPELDDVSGKYFSDCKEARQSKNAMDKDLADKLWTLSERITFNPKQE